MTNIILLFLSAAVISGVVAIDITHRELSANPAAYRLFWIKWRNRLDAALKPFVSIYRSCALANKIMRSVGFRGPVWPAADTPWRWYVP